MPSAPLRRAPGFTAAAVVTLALGIGATTTIFTVVNGVLLRSLPYAEADRIANIWNDFGEDAQSLPAVSPLDFRDYQRRSRTFESFAAASAGNAVGLRGNLTGEGEPERVELTTVTANFFPLFSVHAAVRPQLPPRGGDGAGAARRHAERPPLAPAVRGGPARRRRHDPGRRCRPHRGRRPAA